MNECKPCPDCGREDCPYHLYSEWESGIGISADTPCFEEGKEGCNCWACEVFNWWENTPISVRSWLYGLGLEATNKHSGAIYCPTCQKEDSHE